MTSREANPPRLAIWCLRHLCPGTHNEALTGDLIERLEEGASRSWFWRQVFVACTTGVWNEIRCRWVFLCYAAAGTVAVCLAPVHGPTRVPMWLHWSDLPWPLSQFVFELSSPVILTLAGLCVLAGGLAIEQSFRLAYLLRTWIINFALIAIGHYSIDAFPWLLRPIPGDPYHKVLVIPPAAQVLLLFSAFLVAAWLGCPMTKRADGAQGLTA